MALVALACKMRKINAEIGDSYKIYRTVLYNLISHVVCWIVGDTIWYWGRHPWVAANAWLLVGAFQVASFSVASVAFLILPRMYNVWYKRKHGRLPDSVVVIGESVQVHCSFDGKE